MVGPRGTVHAPSGTPVFAWKGETAEEYWWCTDHVFRFAGGLGPDMIVDDGGDATQLVHLGVGYEAKGAVPAPADGDSPDHRSMLALFARSLDEDAHRFTRIAARMRGVTEETTIGIARLTA